MPPAGIIGRTRSSLSIWQSMSTGPVVHDDRDDRQPVGDCGADLVEVHVERAVARDMDHGAAREGNLCTDRGAVAEAHRAEAA